MMNEIPGQSKIQEYLHRFQDSKKLWLVGPCEMKGHMGAPEEPVIFVDGGVRHRKEPIGVTLGDGDSGLQNLDLMLPAEKNYSDLAYTLGLIPESCSEARLWGFLGGHRDHEIIGFGEVHHFLEKRIEPMKVSFEGKVDGLSAGEWDETVMGPFSILAFRETKLSLSGECDYPFKGPAPFPAMSSRGLSNEGHGRIRIRNDGPVFLFRR